MYQKTHHIVIQVTTIQHLVTSSMTYRLILLCCLIIKTYFLHFQITCQRFNQMMKITSQSRSHNCNYNLNKKVNQYWHDQSNLLCNNLPSNYNANKWYQFYMQLIQLFLEQNYYNSKTNQYKQGYNQQTQEIDYNQVIQESLHNYDPPIIRCCRLDMLFKINIQLSNVNVQIAHQKSNHVGISHYIISKTSQKLITKVLLNCLQYNSINLTRHLFNLYSQDIVLICYQLNGRKTTYALLIESIKTGNDEIIELILNDPNCNNLIATTVREKSKSNPLHEISQCAKYASIINENNGFNLMIDKRVGINGQDWDGDTPLYLIVSMFSSLRNNINTTSDDHDNDMDSTTRVKGSLGEYFIAIIKHLINMLNINTNIVNERDITELEEALWWLRIEKDTSRRLTNMHVNGLRLIKLLLTSKNTNIEHFRKNGINVFDHAIANGDYNLGECLHDHLVNRRHANDKIQIDINQLINGQITKSTTCNKNTGATPYILACRYVATYWNIESTKDLNGVIKMIQFLITIYQIDLCINETCVSGSDIYCIFVFKMQMYQNKHDFIPVLKVVIKMIQREMEKMLKMFMSLEIVCVNCKLDGFCYFIQVNIMQEL